jgi:hypothetical protein
LRSGHVRSRSPSCSIPELAAKLTYSNNSLRCEDNF